MTELAITRRGFVQGCSAALGALLVGDPARAAEVPADNPTAHLNLDWTGTIRWSQAVDVTTVEGGGNYWDARLEQAQQTIAESGGGVVYFPPGVYAFERSIRLKDGVILRGVDPNGATRAHDDGYRPPTRFEFPRYEPVLRGNGTPIDTAFMGIVLDDSAAAANCGVVNVEIQRGHIQLGEAEGYRCGKNRIVYGCVLRNAAVADPAVPDTRIGQHRWQRFTARHHAAIDVKASENILVANNRLPKSGDENFVMNGYVMKPARGGPDCFDGVVFDYDNRPGIYVCHYCIGGAGGSGDDGTPQTHPWGFRKGIVIRDNYIYNTGRMAIGFCGDGVLCANNVVRFAKDVWRPTTTGLAATSGSSTNDNRAIEMRGWRWAVEGNDYEVHRNIASDRKYPINDGEGLMHEDHCNSDIRDSRLVNNRGNSYLSIYKCGTIDGLLIAGNDISTPGDIADIFVVANRNSGNQACRNVTIEDNTTHSNGIHIAGSPASDNVIRNNRHAGREGVIRNEAAARVSGNQGYRVETSAK